MVVTGSRSLEGRRGGPGSTVLTITLWVLVLGIVNASGAWLVVRLHADGSTWAALALLLGLIATTAVFTVPRLHVLRYIWPGLVFFVLLSAYPIGYTVWVAFTNYGTGHMLSRQQVIDQLESRLYTPPDARRIPFTAFETATGALTLVLDAGEAGYLVASGDKVRPADPVADGIADTDGDGRVDRLGDLLPLTTRALVGHLAELQQRRYEWNGATFGMVSFREFGESETSYRYDAETDSVIDRRTGTAYRPEGGFFVSAAGERLEPGFVSSVGLANFARMLSDPAISGPFLRVFAWTFIWAAVTVVIQFIAGLTLAVVLNDPYLWFRNFYRSVLILPYAIPAFISALIWVGLFNTEVGAINGLITALGAGAVAWLQDPNWARAALFLVNLWLGYPYMMIVTLGALQSISAELYEAAIVDGASSWDMLRTITLPLLMISIAPLLVGSFAFNFNNFNVIFLVTGGGPPMLGAGTPAGHTDILISYTYRLAFQGGQGTQLGFAAAISMIIFVIVGVVSAINFRLAGRFERVAENV